MDAPNLEPVKRPMECARRVVQSALQNTEVLDLGWRGWVVDACDGASEVGILSTMTFLTKPLGLHPITSLVGKLFAPGYLDFAIFSHLCTFHHPREVFGLGELAPLGRLPRSVRMCEINLCIVERHPKKMDMMHISTGNSIFVKTWRKFWNAS